MKIKPVATSAAAVVSAFALSAMADMVDRPGGIKIGERLTLRPYVSVSYTYDSNIDSTKHSRDGSFWVIDPGIGISYKDDKLQVTGRAYYNYHAQNRYHERLNSSSYGENLSISWRNSMANEKGWSFIFTESFAQISQDDDMTHHNGRGVGRDRQTFQFGAAVERRINENWHAGANASYYLLDYDNNIKEYAPLYGWKRWVVGGETGYMASRWLDFIVAGTYQHYTQDNISRASRLSDNSRAYSLMGGIGSRATERITYRAMAGWSRFEYADGDLDTQNGWVYQISGNWKISDTWSTMLLASSYYQPSEREVACASRIDSISWGIAHSMVRGKLSSTFDINYRRETNVYSYYDSGDYDDDIITGRFGLTYTLNRFLQVYGSIEYQTDMCSGKGVRGHAYDYDRFRGTVGMRLTY